MTETGGEVEGGGGDFYSRMGWQVCERGVLVRPRDAGAFAEALACAVSDEDLRRTLGERGRHFVEERYSVKRLLADVLRLYEELTGGRAAVASERAAAAEATKELGRAAARLKGE
jgi:glycosyltransferase involved in cell wall biosynthesis